jgi:hypothetical protein
MTTTPAPPERRKRFYVAEGDGFVPTGLSISPWRGDAQNGLALGLMAVHTLEARPEAKAGKLARLTLDILRPAPAQLTRVTWRVARGGRRVWLLEAEIIAGGETAARASALFVAPAGPAPDAQPLRPPGALPQDAPERLIMPRGTGLLAVRDATRAEARSGRQSLWLKLTADIVPGSPASPIATAVAISDFGGSTLRDYSADWAYPNMDIAVHFSRTPRGEWVHAASAPMMLGHGVAVVDHHLSDLNGPFARAHQTLFLSRRQKASGA